MPGDLYDAGGVLYLVLGSLIWGALLGLIDGWKGHLPAFCAAAITALVATHCAMSIERDFDHEVAGLIQMLLVLIVTAGVIALARRRNPEFALPLNPRLEHYS
jgi:Na+/H+ antiporter NhaC